MAKKVQKNKDVLYVQLGKRRNGRIVKAENYDIKEFFDLCLFTAGYKEIIVPDYSWFDKTFNTKKYKFAKRQQLRLKEYFFVNECVTEGMIELIKEDKFGRKKK